MNNKVLKCINLNKGNQLIYENKINLNIIFLQLYLTNIARYI